MKLSHLAKSSETPINADDANPWAVSHIRGGKVCPVVRRKDEPGAVYIVREHSVLGIGLDCVHPEPFSVFESYDDFYYHYTDIPPELLFLRSSMYSTFMPVVFINEDS